MRKMLFLIITFFSFSIVFAKDVSNYKVDNVYYDLNIGETYDETITAVFSKDAYEIADNDESDIPSLEYIFLYEKQYPILSNMNIEYDKSIKKDDDKVIVTLKYSYSKKDFANSTFLNNCFENFEVNDNEYKLSGKFYCLHDKRYNISVKDKYSVFTTTIDKDEVGIIYKVDKKTGKILLIINYILAIGLSVFLLVKIIKIVRKK